MQRCSHHVPNLASNKFTICSHRFGFRLFRRRPASPPGHPTRLYALGGRAGEAGRRRSDGNRKTYWISAPRPVQAVARGVARRVIHTEAPTPVPQRAFFRTVQLPPGVLGPSTGKEYCHGGSTVSMHQLIEAGGSLGHQPTAGTRHEAVHLRRAQRPSHPSTCRRPSLVARALEFVSATVQAGGKVLFVGTSAGQARSPMRRASAASTSSNTAGGRHADQLEDHLPVDQAPQELEEQSRRHHGPDQEEVLPAHPERDKLEMSLGASATWAACPT